MKNISFCFFISYFLVGCGDELGSFTGGGVSLGGTGLPTSGGGTTPLPSEQDTSLEYIIWTKGLYEQSCEDLTISAYLLNSDTGEALLEQGNGTFVPNISEQTPNNLSLVVTIKNTNEYPIYEYRNSCESPVQLNDQNQNIYTPIDDASCVNNNDEYQIYLPSESKTYKLKYKIPLEFQSWNLMYNARYSVNQYVPIDQRKQCSNFSLNFAVERM